MLGNFFDFYADSAVSTSALIGCILFIHFIFQKKSSSQLFFLWIFVLLRLLFPVEVETDWGWKTYTIPEEISDVIPDNGLEINNLSDKNPAEHLKNHASKKQTVTVYSVMQLVWLTGILAFVLNYFIKMYALSFKKKKAVRLCEYKNVKMWNDSTGACVIGIIHPVIYVPYGCDGKPLDIIIRHEQQHIRHFDYLFVLFFYFALALNWYNPLAWLAYHMAKQDIEKACDERVLLQATQEERQAYAKILLEFYKNMSADSAIPGFGAANIKDRMKNIGIKKEKKKIYSVLFLSLGCLILGACSFCQTKDHMGNKQADYGVMAKEMASDKIGTAIPSLIYIGHENCIFYDYHGVFWYNFNEQVFTDYLAFSDIEFSSNTQGDNATMVLSENNGQTVHIINRTSKEMYTYDSKEKNGISGYYSEDTMPETSMDSLSTIEKQIDHAISPIYSVGANTGVYWTYEGDGGRYSNLYLTMNKNGNIIKYSVFR